MALKHLITTPMAMVRFCFGETIIVETYAGLTLHRFLSFWRTGIADLQNKSELDPDRAKAKIKFCARFWNQSLIKEMTALRC